MGSAPVDLARDPADVVVVIVTFRAASTIRACLASIPREVPVIVVDNASDDGTAAIVAAARPTARVIANHDNLGFAAAANRGIGAAGDAHVVLLNPDATLAPGVLGAMAAFADATPRAAAVSAFLEDEHGRPERVGGGRDASIASVAVHELGLGAVLRSQSLYRPGDPRRPLQLDWVAGTAVWLRREALDDVGPLDESYFLYAEDLDWCRRARQKGWECWVTPAARATHLGSSSVNAAESWVDQWRLGSLDRYIGRAHGRKAQTTTRLIRAAGAALRGATFRIASLIVGDPRRTAYRERAASRLHDALALLTGRFR